MFWQQVINGLSLGAVYALLAVGYSIVYSILELINFAHGAVYMLGAYVTLTLMLSGVSFYVAFAIAALFCAALGIAIERYAYRPLRQTYRIAATLSAIAVSFILQNGALLHWGAQQRVFPSIVPDQPMQVAGVLVSPMQVLILAVSLAAVVAIELALRWTKVGLAVRAVSQDIPIASLMGVNVNALISLAFGVGSILAALGGVLVGSYLNSIYVTMGDLATLKAFTAAILGGIGSITGALLGAMILGLSESLTGAYISPGYRDAIVFIILIAVLLFRPNGLMGRRIAIKV
jgi:branched-chain amino acid transport system permease protein